MPNMQLKAKGSDFAALKCFSGYLAAEFANAISPMQNILCIIISCFIGFQW